MSHISPQSYKGSRDVYPEDYRVREYIFGTWKKISLRFGYEQYDVPLLEPVEVYAAKTGQEIVNEQSYSFTDRGGREVMIRPEMTPSVSRIVAARRQELAIPARLFSIANFMRYERPQRGREREFWQLNADLFGVEGAQADAEIIIMASALMKEFNAKDDMYTIRINNRELINYIMTDYLLLDTIQAHMMIKLFDRKDKMSPEDFLRAADEIFAADVASDGIRKIKTLLAMRSMADLPSDIIQQPAAQEVQQLFGALNEAGVANAVFDISLMRGFDYYTGMVFEVFDNHPDNNRSLFGGGRYDGLVGLFGVDPIATVGFAPGETPMLNFLESHKLLPHLHSTTDIYLIPLGDHLSEAQKLTQRLRAEGVNVAVDITERKTDKQIKTALKLGVPFMLFVGEKEIAEEQYQLKEVATSVEQRVAFERVVTIVTDHRLRERGEEDELAAILAE